MYKPDTGCICFQNTSGATILSRCSRLCGARHTLPCGRPALLAGILLLVLAAAAPAQDMRRVYERGEKFLPASASKLVLNLSVEPS